MPWWLALCDLGDPGGRIPGFRIVLCCFTHDGVAMWFLCLCVLPYQYLSWYNAITSPSSIVTELDRRSLSSLPFWCVFFAWLCFCVFCCFSCCLVVCCVSAMESWRRLDYVQVPYQFTFVAPNQWRLFVPFERSRFWEGFADPIGLSEQAGFVDDFFSCWGKRGAYRLVDPPLEVSFLFCCVWWLDCLPLKEGSSRKRSGKVKDFSLWRQACFIMAEEARTCLISIDFPAPEIEPESAHLVSVSVPWLRGDLRCSTTQATFTNPSLLRATPLHRTMF